MSGHPVPSAKPEFPPLLSIGRHPMDLSRLTSLCVDAFPSSSTRRSILRRLIQVIRKLESDRIKGELWIDGSFLTQKLDPEDVDLILRIRCDIYDNGSSRQKATIDWVGSNLKATHDCDSYVYFEYPESHPAYWLGEYMYSYWMKQWGFSRRGEMKGIAVYVLGSDPAGLAPPFLSWMMRRGEYRLVPPSSREAWA